MKIETEFHLLYAQLPHELTITQCAQVHWQSFHLCCNTKTGMYKLNESKIEFPPKQK